jgi:hypothetical protein
LELSTRFRRPLARAAPVLVAIALALATTWPLVLHLGSRIPGDLGDPLFFTWQIGWIGHATLTQPLDFFQANIFWPLKDSLAFTDSLIGFAPAAILAAAGLHSAVVTYNLLYLFAPTLAFLGAYLLARELGTGRLGGLCAGAAFAYAPWRLAHVNHLPLLASGAIPLALFLLVRGYRRRSGRTVFAGWLVTAWQMTLSLALDIPIAYLLLVLTPIAAVFAWSHRRVITRGLAVATIAGLCVVGVATAVHLRPYFRVVDHHPETERSAAYVASLSPTWRGFFAAPEQSLVWGDATERARRPLQAPQEQTLFPGVTIAALALVGLLSSVYSRRLRFGLGAGTALCAVISTGMTSATGARRFLEPYRFLFDHAPGWDTVRTSGRVNVLTSLGLALLAGAGAAAVARRLRRALPPGARWHHVPRVAAVVLVAAIVIEGFGPLPFAGVPPPPAGLANLEAPVLHLPQDTSAYVARYMYWSTANFDPIVNGTGSFKPTRTERLLTAVRSFPDATSVERLRRIGVRTVVLHREFLAGTPWQSAPGRPIEQLPVTREVRGDLVIYRLARPRDG